MAKEEKVFDIANPGSAKPDIGSKPMIVGHTSMASDPMVRSEEADKAKKAEDETSQEVVARGTKVVEPIHEKKDVQPIETQEKPTDPSAAVAEKSEKEGISEPESKEPKSETTPEESAAKHDTSDQNEADDVTQDNEDRLAELIESKQYEVPIKQASTSAFRTFLVTFFIVILLGTIIFLALIDAEVIDAGVNVPFDFL